MKSSLGRGLLLSVIAAVATPAWGFKISPCLRILTLENGGLSQKRIRYVNLCPLLNSEYKMAVHEHMTLGSLREYRGHENVALEPTPQGWWYQYMVDRKWSKQPGGRVHQSHAIMFGNWWNDDPLMRVWGQGMRDFVGGALADRKMLKDGRSTYPGGIANCNVPAGEHLGRSSHFGQLQHLHFMTDQKQGNFTPKERVSETTSKALEWMAFAYRVATGDLSPEQPLTPELQAGVNLPSVGSNHCVREESVRIRTLFSRIGQDMHYRHRITPDVALGSMLHILQDSFSPSHACRTERLIGSSRQALLLDVSNYLEQDADEHGALDAYPEWLTEYVVSGRRKFENDPIAVGAWLIGAVDEKLPWKQVEAHLRHTIFAQAETAEPSTSDVCIR